MDVIGTFGSAKRRRARDLQNSEPTEFLRPIASGLFNVLPSQESNLREYMRVLIKRKWMVIAVIVGIFVAVAIASLRQTPVYDAVGRRRQQGGFQSHCLQGIGAGHRLRLRAERLDRSASYKVIYWHSKLSDK